MTLKLIKAPQNTIGIYRCSDDQVWVLYINEQDQVLKSKRSRFDKMRVWASGDNFIDENVAISLIWWYFLQYIICFQILYHHISIHVVCLFKNDRIKNSDFFHEWLTNENVQGPDSI